MRYAQLVMGPAGSGKSTFCSTMAKHAEVSQRIVKVVNLGKCDQACVQFVPADLLLDMIKSIQNFRHVSPR